MEIKVLEKEKNRIKFEIIGDRHTMGNILSKELWNDKSMVISGYRLEHPLVSNPVLICETSGKDPVKAIEDAVKRLKAKNKEFLTKFKKVVK